ncbi:peroxisomal membrane protein 4 [Neoconidiobolus thromboides FSU 785]|nr:peroxisomal membrane protein 4 [Neoconidiobolus thromboides FSU 785]
MPDAIYHQLTDFILHPDNRALLSIVKGFRNGIVYGTKVRFPHALVMTLLFRSGSIKDKIKAIFLATRTHAKNLAFFVAIYKTTMLVLSKLNHSKEAGMLGGYVVFGKEISINKQIVLYLFARVVLGLANLPIKYNYISQPDAYPIFAAVVWGTVMWLFRHEASVLQPSLRASMQYLYVDSNYWSSLKTFIWHNK